MIRGLFFGLLAACIVWAIIVGAASATIFMLNTLFLTEPLAFTLRNLIAAAIFNLYAGWVGAAPWFIMRQQ